MERKYGEMSRQNIIFILVMFLTIVLISAFEKWLKTNVAWFYPFRWVLFGIVIATGDFLNALPGQVGAEDTSGQPLGRRAVTFLGWVVAVVLMFASFDWFNEKYPAHSKELRFAVLILMSIAWSWRSARLKPSN